MHKKFQLPIFCNLTTGYSVKPGFLRKSCITILGNIWIGIEFLIEPVESAGLLRFLKQWKETTLHSKICKRQTATFLGRNSYFRKRTCPAESDCQHMGSPHLSTVPWKCFPSFGTKGAGAGCKHSQPTIACGKMMYKHLTTSTSRK